MNSIVLGILIFGCIGVLVLAILLILIVISIYNKIVNVSIKISFFFTSTIANPKITILPKTKTTAAITIILIASISFFFLTTFWSNPVTYNVITEIRINITNEINIAMARLRSGS